MHTEENSEVAVFGFLWFDSFGHWINGGGSKNPASEAPLLPLILASFIGSSAVAAKILLLRYFCCL